jgi:hypothetical protein
VIYVGWLLVHLELLRELPREVGVAYETGSAFLLFAFLLAWSSDTGAYFVGMAFGRHKLFPRVSPAKSVEGAVGGMLSTMAAALIGREYLVLDSAGQPLITVPQDVAFGVVVGIANQLGDLVESLLKRDAAVKDTSSMIPGHGGVLDRFDSLLFRSSTTPVSDRSWTPLSACKLRNTSPISRPRTRWSGTSPRSISTTSAPSASIALAQARPIPEAAPVTAATLPLNWFVMVSFPIRRGRARRGSCARG